MKTRNNNEGKGIKPQEAYDLFKSYIESRNEEVLAQSMSESESYYSIGNCVDNDFYSGVVYINKNDGNICEMHILEYHPMNDEVEVDGKVKYNRYKIENGIVTFDKVVSYE